MRVGPVVVIAQLALAAIVVERASQVRRSPVPGLVAPGQEAP